DQCFHAVVEQRGLSLRVVGQRFRYPNKVQLPAMPHIKGGKLVPFALAAEERSADLPTVPTFKELGYPELNDLGMSWFGLVVPAGTPQPVVRRLQDAALESVRSPAVQERLKSLGAVAVTMDQAQFPAQIAAELQRNKALLNKLNVKPE
ncbi:tripartite tricarboxylate transporter substrate-binding protein, partial [Bordetella holmesii]|uniref:tripartite tricarboxylate transporter substrate-binding protein n=1 Tax=Bordetella holmesii TaxID=35814 RepID=UPI0022849E80